RRRRPTASSKPGSKPSTVLYSTSSLVKKETHMARYLVEVPHTKSDCLDALDSVAAFSNSLLDRIDWGCGDGVHTGWLTIEAQDADTARMVLPTNIRHHARAVQVMKFSAEQIQSFHDAH